MPKNILQDIVPKNQKTIRRIPIPERRAKEQVPTTAVKFERRHSHLEQVQYDDEHPSAAEIEGERPTPKPAPRVVTKEPEPPVTRAKSRSKKPFWRRNAALLSVIVIIFAGVIVGTSVFASVTVKLYPKKYKTEIATSIEAKKTPSLAELGYTISTYELEKSLTVPASGQKNVEKRATGTVVIYNADSAAEQRLIINTRLETPTGLIYRLTQSVVVPGRTTSGGKVIPGSVEAKVQADNSGDKYNIGLTDFTIPGFKGTPKFETFYARSKTPMTGGFVGMMKVVDETLLQQKKAELKKSLEEEAKAVLSTKVPPGEVFFPTLITTTITDIPDSSTSKDSAVIKQKITVHALSFLPDQFALILASKSISNFDGTPVSLTNPSKLKVEFAGNPDITRTSIMLSVKGSGEFVSKINESAIATTLAGKSKKSFNQALSSIKGLDRAEATIRPVWRMTFPTNPERIKTTVILD